MNQTCILYLWDAKQLTGLKRKKKGQNHKPRKSFILLENMYLPPELQKRSKKGNTTHRINLKQSESID